MRIAMLVPAPDYPEAWRWAFDVQAEALRSAGAEVEPLVWTEVRDASRFDLILPLVAWGYHLKYDRWLAFLDQAAAERWPLVNPEPVLRWNSDKAYLAELAEAGVATVPSLVVAQCHEADLGEARRRFGADSLVIKPPVSAGAAGTHRIRPSDPLPHDARGQRMIVQPLLEQIASEGEYSVILFDGAFSHAVVKRPVAGDFRVQPHFGGSTEPCEPPPGAVALARSALAVAPAEATYARVDMVPDGKGGQMIMELELIEPALFLDHAPDGGSAFAGAILSAAQPPSE